MSTASASSLVLPSLNPKTISLYNPKPSFFSFSSLKFHAKSISISSTVYQPSSSRFVRHVAVSSEYEQDEDVLSDGDEGSSFSPDLKLFVGNLPFNVDSAQLAGLFETAGNVEMVEVIYDKVTGRSRGFGFVTMSSAEEVEAAAQQFNGYELEGRPLRVNAGPPPPRREESFSRGPRGGREGYGGGNREGYGGGNRSSFGSGNRVYVGNLSWGVNDQALETLFSEQGKVVEAKVVYDRESGRSRGFGFVTYNSSEEVDGAIESLNGADLDGRSIRVSVAEAKPRRQF
ncbi:hypothetical protein LWI28_000016 [Acer negundo]|uniref:RRM domain-containing protein n=1 Tax=Acer negundo TaxID=4023 RepID=A0AAD5NDY5_ACENE|nr:hypothetical protein LWI28_000016 [Acer negundo]KAK4833490.1 hypothetical protein QYF36_005950 [Acer negundo]